MCADLEDDAEKAFELLKNYGHLPCTLCWGLGLIPAEAFGRDSDGAPITDDEEPCPEGCAIPGWLVAERNDNQGDREEVERLRARVAELESATEDAADMAAVRAVLSHEEPRIPHAEILRDIEG